MNQITKLFKFIFKETGLDEDKLQITELEGGYRIEGEGFSMLATKIVWDTYIQQALNKSPSPEINN